MEELEKAAIAAVLAVKRGYLTPEQALKAFGTSPGQTPGQVPKGPAAASARRAPHQTVLWAVPAAAKPAIDAELAKLAGSSSSDPLASIGIQGAARKTIHGFRGKHHPTPEDLESLRKTLVAEAKKGPPSAAMTTLARKPPLKSSVNPALTRQVADEARYTIKLEHARGGMGRVLLALDNDVGREVALKELLPADHDQKLQRSLNTRPSAGAREDVERFLREAKITGQLEHPNIVPVYEIGQREDGSVYYTMKFVRGHSLAKRLDDIAKSPELNDKTRLKERLKLLDDFVDACNAIAYAHAKGVIHRDLKPDNIMLGNFGETLVLDWGLARVKGQDDVTAQKLKEGTRAIAHAPVVTGGRRLTQAGVVFGTPSYMAPEQAIGELNEVDEQSDVYALGAMLFEICTGKPPRDGEDMATLIAQAERGEIMDIKGGPVELRSIALKALEFDKPKRYRSALELARDVVAFQNGEHNSAHRYTLYDQFRRFIERHGATTIIIVAASFMAAVSMPLLTLLHRSDETSIPAEQGTLLRGASGEVLLAYALSQRVANGEQLDAGDAAFALRVSAGYSGRRPLYLHALKRLGRPEIAAKLPALEQTFPDSVQWQDAAEAGFFPGVHIRSDSGLLRKGDVVVAVNGREIVNLNTFEWLFAMSEIMTGGASHPVEVRLMREGKPLALGQPLSPREIVLDARGVFALGGPYPVPPLGAIVIEVMAGSATAGAGLQPGDAIVALDGRPIQCVVEFFQTWAQLPAGEEHLVGILRNGESLSFALPAGIAGLRLK